MMLLSSSSFESSSSLSLFGTLECAQNEHGISHQDYSQYHHYCTSKLSRLRHVQPVKALLVHNPKYNTSSSTSTSTETTNTTTTFKSSSQQQQQQRRHGYAARPLIPNTTTTTTDDNHVNNAGHHHPNVIWNIVFQAERAWAQACALQQQQSSNNNTTTIIGSGPKPPKNVHGHVQRRLNKAVKYATTLVQLVEQQQQQNKNNNNNNNNNTAQQQQQQQQQFLSECRAYCAWMEGNAALEHKQYATAYRAYKQSMVTLWQLVQDTTTSTTTTTTTTQGDADHMKQILSLQDTWMTKMESTIRPLLRYCQYEAKQELTPQDLELPMETNTTTTKNKKKKKQEDSIVLSFRGTDVYLEQDPSYKPLAVLFLKLEESLGKMKQKKKETKDDDDNNDKEDKDDDEDDADESHFLHLLSDLDDAIALAQTELNKYTSTSNTGTGIVVDGPNMVLKRQELNTIQTYFQYQKLVVWRQQQEQRMNKIIQTQKTNDNNNKNNKNNNTNDPEVMVHAYDALLQNAQAIVNLKSNDNNDNNHDNDDDDDDDAFALEAQAHVIRIRALRCYSLAVLYAEHADSLGVTSKQILSLLKQAKRLSKRAQEEMVALQEDEDNDDDDNDDEKKTNDDDDDEIQRYIQELEELDGNIQILTCRVQATRYIQKMNAAGGAGGSGTMMRATDRPLWLRLDELDGGTITTTTTSASLVDDPPLPLPMPCKGYFYDIAWQHAVGLDFPTDILQQRMIQENEPETVKANSGGILGWLIGART